MLAKCILFLEIFLVYSFVISQDKEKKHCLKSDHRFRNKSNIFSTITTIVDDNGLSHQNQVIKAEMLCASHVANKNISFKSCNEIADQFNMIFSDCPMGVVV